MSVEHTSRACDVCVGQRAEDIGVIWGLYGACIGFRDEGLGFQN